MIKFLKKLFTIRRSSNSWLRRNPWIKILDYDGWDRRNFMASMEEKITKQEFNRRVSLSTTEISVNDIVDNSNFGYKKYLFVAEILILTVAAICGFLGLVYKDYVALGAMIVSLYIFMEIQALRD